MKFYDLTKLKPAKVEANFGFGYKVMTLNYPNATLKTTTVKFTEKQDVLGVDITSDKPISYVRVTWNVPGFAENSLLLRDAFERNYDCLEWGKLNPDKRCMWYFATSDKVSTNAYGVMTGCNTFCYFDVDKDSISLIMDTRIGSFPVHLNGRTLHATDVVCTKNLEGETPFKTLQRFCKIMCPRPKLAKKPVYGSNSWYYAFRFVTQQDVVNDANLLAECTKDLENRPFCVIDDGWESVKRDSYWRTHEIPWKPNMTKFPDLNGLIEYIKSKDLIPGIWVRPLLGSLAFPLKMRSTHFRLNDSRIILDPTVPETLDFVSKTIKGFVDQGYKLIKHDFSTRDILGYYHWETKFKKVVRTPRKFHNNTKTNAEVILELYKTIRDSAGDDIVIIGCNTVSHLSAGFFEVQRIGDDTSPNFWSKNLGMGVNSLAFRLCQHNTFYACDADCVGFTAKIPWKNIREWLRLVSVSGTPLFTSIKPALITPEIKEDLKKAYELASKQEEIALPTTWFDDKYPTHWQGENSGTEYDFDWSGPSDQMLKIYHIF